MDKIWNNRDKSIGEFLFKIGKHCARKNMPKSQEAVNEMKKEFKSLHKLVREQIVLGLSSIILQG